MEHVEAKFALALFKAATRRVCSNQRLTPAKRSAAASHAHENLDLSGLEEHEQCMLRETFERWFTQKWQVHRSVSHS